jgi:type II secretion system protein H
MGHFRKKTPRFTAGFTLIEILVVTFVVATMIGMLVLHMTRSDRDLLRDEADRLTVLLYGAREEAVLRGQLIALELNPTGYRFLYVEKDAFTPFKDGPLVGRDFADNIRVQLEVEGQPPAGRHGLVIDPTSTLPTFNFTLSLNDARWWILGQNNGTICSTPEATRCPPPPARTNAS